MNRDEKILDYIDGLLSAEEAEHVREMLANNTEWKARYDSFMELNGLLNTAELLSPSISFADKTMAKIAADIHVESKNTTPIVRFFQLTGWLWLGLAILLFTEFNTTVFSQLMQQGVSDFTIMTNSSIHMLFGNSAMLWAFGVMLLAYVVVRNYEQGTNLFNEIVN